MPVYQQPSPRRLAVDLKTVNAVEGGELEVGGEPTGLAEHHVGGAAVGTGVRCPDDEVGEAVAIDIAGASYRGAAPVPRCLTIDLEAIGAVEVGEFKN